MADHDIVPEEDFLKADELEKIVLDLPMNHADRAKYRDRVYIVHTDKHPTCGTVKTHEHKDYARLRQSMNARAAIRTGGDLTKQIPDAPAPGRYEPV